MPSSRESYQLRDGTHVSYVSWLCRHSLYGCHLGNKYIYIAYYILLYIYYFMGASLVAQMVKNLPAIQETQV